MRWTVPKLWKGKTCCIIGGGASINKIFNVPADVIDGIEAGALGASVVGGYLQDTLSKFPTIGVNNAYLMGNWINILFFGDASWYKRHVPNELAMPDIRATCHVSLRDTENLLYIQRDKENKYGLTDDPSKIVWNRNSGAAAINLAIHLGVSRIFLFGFDMMSEGLTTHWHYRHKKYNRRTDEAVKCYATQLKGFPVIQNQAKSLGVQIYNVNLPDSTAIHSFPIISLPEALELAQEPEPEPEMSIGWYPGHDGWAFTNLTNHCMNEMEGDHRVNEPGDVNFLCYPQQLNQPAIASLPNKILHLDGNRWWGHKPKEAKKETR